LREGNDTSALEPERNNLRERSGNGMAAWLTPTTDHYRDIASGLLPESETIASGVILDYDLDQLPDMDWCSQAWIKHWNLADEIDETRFNMWPRKLGTNREMTQTHLVNQVEQAIAFPEDFLFRTSKFHGAFKAILDKQRSIYRALNTLCGEHTTRTATMSFHALRP
jgi:hypothetical protein